MLLYGFGPNQEDQRRVYADGTWHAYGRSHSDPTFIKQEVYYVPK